MKTSSFLIMGSVFFFISCKKNNTLPNNDLYLNTTPGSTWQYQLADTTDGLGTDTLLTITSSSEDTIMYGKSYHIYTNSLSSSLQDYDRVEGNNYYSWGDTGFYLPVPGITGKSRPGEILYLKSDLNIGDTYLKYDTLYTQNDLNPGEMSIIPIKTICTIIEKNSNRSVNNINYSEVIHLSSSSSSPFFSPPYSFVNNGDFYYAKKIGLIESNIVFQINYIPGFDQHFHTTLITSDIK